MTTLATRIITPPAELLAGFEQYLINDGRAPHTTRGYTGDMRLFAEWFEQSNGAALAPALLTPTDLREYRRHLLQRNAAAATINRKLNAVGAFAKWARAEKWIDFDPTEGVKKIDRQPLAPKWLDKHQQHELVRRAERELNAAGTDQQKRRAVRDLSMVLLLLHTGLRVSELCALTIDDLTLSERKGRLRVAAGKGLKQRDVPLNDVALRAVHRWQEARPGVDHRFLFTGNGGEPIQARGVQHRLQELGRLAGLEVTPHTLRHTFAKGMVDAGATLEKVAALLGHSSLNTTRIYTTPSALDLEKAVGLLAN